MKFPAKIVVTVRDKMTLKPLVNTIVFLEILAPKKNNYEVGPMKTNDDGEVIFFEHDVIQSIQWYQNEFIMDYASQYEDCLDTFKILIPSGQDLEKSLIFLNKSKDCWPFFEEAFQIIQSSSRSLVSRIKIPVNLGNINLVGGVPRIECLI